MGMTASAARAGAGIAAAYVSIEGAKKAISTTESLAHATIGLHKNLGLSVERASEWAAVAKSRDVDTKALNMSFGTLSKNVQAATEGGKKQAAAFKDLGVSQQALASGDFNRIIGQVSDGMGKLHGGTEKTALAMRLFGRGWQTIVPVLRGGSKAMNEQLALADKYGVTFKGKSIKSLEDFIKAQREAKFATMGLQVAFGTQLAPVLTKLIGKFTTFVAQMRDGTGAGGRFASTMGEVWDRLKPVLTTVKDVATWLGKHPHLLLAAASAWGVYKTAALASLAATKLGMLGLFGSGMQSKLAARAGAAGGLTGKTFAAKAGLAAAAGIAGWEIGTWLRKNVGPARVAGDAIGNAIGKAVYDKGFSWLRKLAFAVVSPGGFLLKTVSGLFDGGGKQRSITNSLGESVQRSIGKVGPKTGRGQGGPRGTGRTSSASRVTATTSGTSKRFYSQDEARALWIRAGGPGGAIADTAAAIAMAESGGDSQVVNSIGATGLWQIHPGGSQYLDPMANARAAVAKYRARGFEPWTTYTGADTGPGGSRGPQTYKQYLGGGAPAASRPGARTKPKPKIPVFNVPNWQDWNSSAQLAPIGKPKKFTTNRSLDNGFLQLWLTHIDNLVGAGVLSQEEGDRQKREELQKIVDSGWLKGEDVLVAQGMIRQLAPEAGPPVRDVIEGALSDVGLHERAGDITHEQATQQMIDVIQGNLGNPNLSERDRLELRAELGDLQKEQTQAVEDNTAALKALQDEVKRNTDFAQSVVTTEAASLTKSLADIVSGRIAGYGIAGRALTPAYGVSRRS